MGARPRPLLVTRPEPEASRWAEQLQAQGLRAEALPLIEIAPTALAGHWPDAPTPWRALMFVSGNAVQHFFGPNPADVSAQWTSLATKTRAWAPGPGTARALQALLPADWIDSPAPDAAQFDSEHLWAVVQHQIAPGDRVLIVRGQDPDEDRSVPGRGSGREWLAQRLAERGASVDFQVVYERRAPLATPQRLARVHAAAERGDLWLFSSSEAIRHLQAWAPQTDWSRGHAIVTHPRIGEAARQAGFGHIHASRPTLEAVVASIESLA